MADTIEHLGLVKKTDGTHIQVSIIQSSACVSCSAKTFCSAADSKEKVIEVDKPSGNYQVGDKVILTGKASTGMMAVFIAFVIPFFIVVLSLFILMRVTHGNEPLSASLSFLFLIPYYIVLRIKKDYLKQKLLFTIKPTIV
jgi:sigma-E factor negative regulatory protein RseC